MTVYTFIPYNTDKDLGKAYEDSMSLLSEGDWAVFIDHDAMFLHPDWMHFVQQRIKENPQYGVFTCKTNRIGSPWQKELGVDVNNHNICYHREVASSVLRERGSLVTDVTHKSAMSGVVIIISKKTWSSIKGTISGFLGVDNDIHYRCRGKGIRVGCMEGLYVYHWYRGDGNMEHLK